MHEKIVTLHDTELECEYAIDPADSGEWDGGLQVSPSSAAMVCNLRVWMAGTNKTHEVTELFGQGQLFDELEGLLL